MEKRDICYEQFTQERTIRISDLIEEVLRHFWLVIVLAVVCGAAFTGYKYMKDTAAAEAEAAEQAAQTAQEAQEEETLTADEQTAVDSDVALRTRLAAQTEYMENSIKMQINPYAEDLVTMQLVLSGENIVINAVYDSISRHVASGALAADLADTYPDIPVNYLTELIGVGYYSDEIVYAEAAESILVFYVTAMNTDEESAAVLAESVLAALESYLATLQKSIGEFSYVMTDSTASVITDTTLLSYQETRTSALITLQESIESLETDMTQAQLSAVAAAMGEETETETVTETVTESAAETVSVSISLKYLLFGAILGVAAAVILIVLATVLRGTLDYAEEFRNDFHISLIGQIHMSEKDAVLVNLWRKITNRRRVLSAEEEKRMVLESITLLCRQNDISRVLLAGSCSSAQEDAWIRDLTAALQERGIGMRSAAGTLFTADGVEALAECEYVVLTEQLRVSSYEGVCECVKTCLEHDRQIIGAVALS